MRVFVFIIWFLLTPLAYSEVKIAIAEVFDQYAPYIQNDLEEAYKLAGVEAVFEVVPNNRAVALANRGEYIGLDLRFEGATGLDNLLKIPVPLYGLDRMYIWSNNDEVFYTATDEIKSERLIALEESTFNRDLEKLGLNLFYVTDITAAIKMADSGRGDLILLSEGLVNSFHARGVKFKFQKVSEPLFEHVFFHWVHKSRADLVPLLTNAIVELNAQGYFEER